jgi:hypothetical protein
MTRAAVRLLFALSVAVVAAAVADPLVEAAANAGWFGRGTFTDRSSVDVVPALVAGTAIVVLQLALRIAGLFRSRVDGKALLRASDQALSDGIGRLLPLTFGLQIVTLFVMETAEQVAVWHHSLGGTVWLGGPVAVSLAAHAFACITVAFAAARAIRVLAAGAARVISIVRELATLRPQCSRGLIVRRRRSFLRYSLLRVRFRIGERAPPATPLLVRHSTAQGEYSCFLDARYDCSSLLSSV